MWQWSVINWPRCRPIMLQALKRVPASGVSFVHWWPQKCKSFETGHDKKGHLWKNSSSVHCSQLRMKLVALIICPNCVIILSEYIGPAQIVCLSLCIQTFLALLYSVTFRVRYSSETHNERPDREDLRAFWLLYSCYIVRRLGILGS